MLYYLYYIILYYKLCYIENLVCKLNVSSVIQHKYICAAYCPGGCLNGGKCGKTGKCSCPIGYSGLHCEIRCV